MTAVKMRCGAELLVTMPPGYPEADHPCPQQPSWMIMAIRAGRLSDLASFCPIHIAGAISHLLDQPDTETINISAIIQ